MTTFNFTVLDAGRNAGFKPWRDHDNPEFVYQLRESNFNFVTPEAFQLVKLNVVTGAVVNSGPLYENASSYGAFGACYVTPTSIHTAGVNLASVSASSKLYLFGSSGFGAGPFDHVVIEFDKTTLDVSDSWVVGPVGTDTSSRDRGVAVMNLDGTILANAGNSDLNAIPNPDTFSTSYIDLFRPGDGAYTRVALNADLGITGYLGLYFSYDAPICFDQAGFLWFITAPWAAGVAGRPNRSTGASTLYKCAVTGALTLVVVDSFAIPDNYDAYAAGAGAPLSFSESFGYRRLVCNPTLEKLYLWSSWRLTPGGDDIEARFLTFDLNAETFSSVVEWSGGETGDISQKLDSIGFTYEDYLVQWQRNPPGLLSSKFNIFQISTGTERQYTLSTDFGYSTDALNDATFFHSFIGGSDYIYAMDVDFETVDGWQVYRDVLFSIIEAADVQIYNRVMA